MIGTARLGVALLASACHTFRFGTLTGDRATWPSAGFLASPGG